MISGAGAYSRLKYESGVHRVQRVPETESGAVSTRPATVAVLPEMEEVDVTIRPEDIEMQVFRSGAGRSAHQQDLLRRAAHPQAHGIVVSLSGGAVPGPEPGKCMRMLASKLYEIEQERLDSRDGNAPESGWHGNAQRAHPNLIFPQGRVTDHRIGLTLYQIDAVMDGDLDEIINALATAEQAEKLKTPIVNKENTLEYIPLPLPRRKRWERH